nr:unnamed protein product [Callosobruchus chinensis]
MWPNSFPLFQYVAILVSFPTGSSALDIRDIKFFYDCFYKTPEKITQYNFILKHCSTSHPVRARKRKEDNNKPKSMTVKYHVKRRDGLFVTVYRETFLKILLVKKDRVLNLLKKFKEQNEMPKERRGGDRVKGKNDDKRTAIRNFVKSYNVLSHTIVAPKRSIEYTCQQN